MVELGRLDLCLNIKDIHESVSFYKKMGLEEVEGDINENWLILTHGNLRLGLYHGYGEGITLNFRGARINQIAQLLNEKGYLTKKEVIKEDGCGSILLDDPDGYALFFDTSEEELDLIDEMKQHPGRFSLKGKKIKLGRTDICLDVQILERSIEFYKNLGLDELEGDLNEGFMILGHSNLRLGLFKGKSNEMTINFRGGDVFEVTKILKDKGFAFKDDAKENLEGGVSSTMFDPDGYFIFFDTSPEEKGLVDLI
jgi:catechol 2,3-dioxygenase-like lactoylglutathione lyase family enzyme